MPKEIAEPQPKTNAGKQPKLRPRRTPEERLAHQLAEAKKDRANAKRAFKRTSEKIDKLSRASGTTITPSEEFEGEARQEPGPGDDDRLAPEVIFKPNPGPQTDFLAASETVVFYGGARGGGKSYAMLVDPLRHCDRRDHRALFIRRTMPELRDLIHKSRMLYPKAFPGARFKTQESTWYFPSGARIEFGYCENMQDAQRYLGQSYTWIGVDELPQFPTPEIWQFLKSSLRSVDPSIPLYMRATGNPGNVGSTWVKKEFINPAPSNTTFTETVTFETPKGVKRVEMTKRFIPATVYDNPFLTYDDSYVAMLASMPEIQRKQYLEGNWDVFEGAAFPEFDRAIHVIPPFAIPNSWPRFRAADWGYSSPACVLWFACDWDNTIYVYREIYGGGLTADLFGDKVMEREQGEQIAYGVLDQSTWAKRGDSGPSIAEIMTLRGCRWRPSDSGPRSRVNGKLEVHRRLSRDSGSGEPRLVIFNNCENLIRTLSTLPLDTDNTEDVDTDAEDHAYDALRYGLMSRPIRAPHIDPSLTGTRRSVPRYAPKDAWFGY